MRIAAAVMDAYTSRPEFELFDLKADPQEVNNLAGSGKYREIELTLKNRLESWMNAQGDNREDMEHFLSRKPKRKRSSR